METANLRKLVILKWSWIVITYIVHKTRRRCARAEFGTKILGLPTIFAPILSPGQLPFQYCKKIYMSDSDSSDDWWWVYLVKADVRAIFTNRLRSNSGDKHIAIIAIRHADSPYVTSQCSPHGSCLAFPRLVKNRKSWSTFNASFPLDCTADSSVFSPKSKPAWAYARKRVLLSWTTKGRVASS